MISIDPYKSDRRYIRPLAIYPYGNNGGIFDPVKARADIKLAALLYDNLTLPASTCIQVPALRSIMLQLGPLLENSVVTLSMRSTASKFSDLVALKSALKDRETRQIAAAYFDRNCKSVIQFDPAAATSNFYHRLRTRLAADLQAAKDAVIQNEIRQFLETSTSQEIFEDVFRTFKDSKYHKKFQAHCKISYALAGAKNANCDVILPMSLVHQGLSHPSTSDPIHRNTKLEVAHDALLEFFSIDTSVIHKIDALDILELKNSSLFERLSV